MKTRRPFLSLAAAAAAALSFTLAGCGGGNAEPPPDNTTTEVVPVVPVVTITNNVAAEVATGDITFTFSFNVDVGTSFTADDVTVTGGTAGAFTRTDGKSATLVVAPPANTTGVVEIAVPAGAVTDAAGTPNEAVSALKAFDTTAVTPPPTGGDVLLADFDTVSPPVVGFEGAEGTTIEACPAGGGSGNCLKVLRSGGQVFALAIIETTVPVTAMRRTISAQVYSPTAGIPMVMKIEGPGGANSGDVAANEAVVAGWQTLTWTFAGVDPALTFDKIVLLPNLGTIDPPPGQAYYFDDVTLLAGATGGGGSGVLTFSTGFASGTRTVEGGEVGGFSGSNLDGYNCNGDPANCGSGGEFVPAQAAADSYFFYYYQTSVPAADLYMGIYVQAPGVVGGFSPAADTPGVQVGSQTELKFKLGQNGEWFGSTTNNFMIVMDLGKRFDVGGNVCRLQLRRVVTPTAAAASNYAIPLSSFALVQDCAGAAGSVAEALAASPISQISFQGVGGGIALSDGTLTSGANLSVPNGAGVYPTTLVVVGGITIE